MRAAFATTIYCTFGHKGLYADSNVMAEIHACCRWSLCRLDVPFRKVLRELLYYGGGLS